MGKQIILCVETNKQADTDSTYIMDAIRHNYVIDNSVKISKIYMKTKTRYNDKGVVRDIDKLINMYNHGKSYVVYCIDTDQIESNQMHKMEFDNISDYCKNNDCELIWFCHDIEEVFIGKKVKDSEKRKTAAEFRKKECVKKLNFNDMRSNKQLKGKSNLLLVMDKYLDRKI